MMHDKHVVITARDTGEKVSARLLICPDCTGEPFLVYIPAGMDHAHFQCVNCGTTFCDGCTEPSELEVIARRPRKELPQ